jgi:maleate isomerase
MTSEQISIPSGDHGLTRTGDWSRRTRIGFILPSVNTVAEEWMHAVCPEGTSIHTARMLMPDALTTEAIEVMDREDAPRALAQISSCRPAVIGYACAASSIVRGAEYDLHLERELATVSGKPCVTAMGAITRALHAQSVRRISLISPYGSAIAEAERRFLEVLGFEIVGERHFGITSAFDLASPSPEEICELALASDCADSEGVLLSCMNFRAHHAIEAIEGVTKKPVVTAVQAILWNALRVAGNGATVSGGGSLFSLALPSPKE